MRTPNMRGPTPQLEHPLGRIGQLADSLRFAARQVTDHLQLSPGGDSYDYSGSTEAVDQLLEAINNLEHYLAGWK